MLSLESFATSVGTVCNLLGHQGTWWFAFLNLCNAREIFLRALHSRTFSDPLKNRAAHFSAPNRIL